MDWNSLKRKREVNDVGSRGEKITMAVDFGTTFSGLAWASHKQV